MGLKLSSLQKIEATLLTLSEATAKRIGFETGVSPRWLLENDTNASPVTPSGRPYAKADYTARRAARTVPRKQPASVGDLLHQYVHLRAVAAAADRQEQGDSFMFELATFLERARSQYGYRAEIYGGSSRVKYPVPSIGQVLKRVAEDHATLAEDHAKHFGPNGICAPPPETSAVPSPKRPAK